MLVNNLRIALNVFANKPSIPPFANTLVISVITGLVAGVVTGIALNWIVRQPDVITRQ